ncbi:MAG: DUF1838 family protein [Chitinophagaceae bacterium]|nr:DUF1838 family protein [Chitinophagaceae bacterium]
MIKKLLLSIVATAAVLSVFSQQLDLKKPADLLTAFVKIRGSLDTTQETVVYNEGTIYAVIPEQPIIAIFKFQLYNIGRFQKTDAGYNLLTREMLLYEDIKTGTILSTWYNPYIKDSVEVLHVWNDPVNSINKADSFKLPFVKLANGHLCFYADIPLFYPSPLKKLAWPQNSRSDMYQAAELFQFFVAEKDIQNKKLKSIPFDLSWSRFSDFLPWMKMGDQPGYLLYSSRGSKLSNGWGGLPQNIKDFVLATAPEYRHAPAIYSAPNMTSWKYFKKLMEERKDATATPHQ